MDSWGTAERDLMQTLARSESPRANRPTFSATRPTPTVIARLVRATHFSFLKKLGRPHKAGDDELFSSERTR
jgi:hypothetical protein